MDRALIFPPFPKMGREGINYLIDIYYIVNPIMYSIGGKSRQFRVIRPGLRQQPVVGRLSMDTCRLATASFPYFFRTG